MVSFAFTPVFSTILRNVNHFVPEGPRVGCPRHYRLNYIHCARVRPLTYPRMVAGSLHEMAVTDIDGRNLALSAMKDKVVLAVNVASACGYTASGYATMKALTEKYGDKGLVVIAVPCNQFGMQEPGFAKEIKDFATARCDKLVITEKTDVNGPASSPIFDLGKTKFPGDCSWNFDCRFLFDRSGKPIARFGNGDSAETIGAAIEKII